MAAETIADFMTKINSVDGTGGAAIDPTDETQKSTLINRLSHAIIELLGRVPVTDLPGAKTAYIAGLTAALTALYGPSQAVPVTVDDAVFGGGSRSSRQTRRRRNGGKRNQRR
jgi:hypothetical protein